MAYEIRDEAFATEYGERLRQLDRYDFCDSPDDLAERHKDAVRDAFNAGWAARKREDYTKAYKT